MKVTDASQIKALAPGKLPEAGRGPAAERSDATDRVSTDDSARVAEAVARAAASAGHVRTLKLQAIEAAVRQGTYRPDPQRIASEILDDAELAARLQALFRK
jgi:negative regulator of flagellin synthesis FlgM